MKKFISLTCLCLLAACSGNKEAEQPKKMVKCDSIKEIWFDSTGTEQLKSYIKCDTVLVEPETKKE
jgi:hypothetical protein